MKNITREYLTEVLHRSVGRIDTSASDAEELNHNVERVLRENVMALFKIDRDERTDARLDRAETEENIIINLVTPGLDNDETLNH